MLICFFIAAVPSASFCQAGQVLTVRILNARNGKPLKHVRRGSYGSRARSCQMYRRMMLASRPSTFPIRSLAAVLRSVLLLSVSAPTQKFRLIKS